MLGNVLDTDLNLAIIFNDLYLILPTEFMVRHRNASTWC